MTTRKTTTKAAVRGEPLSIAEQEVAALPRVKAGAVNAEALIALAAEAAAQADQDETAPDEIEARWDVGDDAPTEIDYLVSQAKARKSRGLAKAAAVKAERGKREVICTDASLPIAVADLLRPVFAGVEVAGTWLPSPTAPQVPYVIVTGDGGERDRAGALNGVITISLHRLDLHKGLNAEQVERRLINARVGVSGLGSVRESRPDTNGVVIDTLRVRVDGVVETTPLINREPSEYVVNQATNGVAATLAGCFPGERGVKLMQDRSYQSDLISVVSKAGKVVSSTVDASGVRTTVVDLVVWAKPVSRGDYERSIDEGHVSRALDNVASEMVGDLSPGLGRVVEAKAVGVPGPAPESGQLDRRRGIRLVCVSRTGSMEAAA